MFIPGDNFFSAALKYDPDLFENAFNNNVLIRKIGRSKIVLSCVQEDIDGPEDPFRTCFLYSNK